MKFTKANVRRWMRDNAADYEDKATGEIDATKLAEDAAAEFNVADTGGPLDDETHWIWDLAATVALEA